jgi:hypothetical protein
VEGNDVNAPYIARIPLWGPDAYSRRMATRLFLRASSAYAALTGVGVRAAPVGASASEGVQSTTWMPPQQFYRSSVGKVADPTLKNVPVYASLPSTNSPGIPTWAVEWSNHQIAGRS